MFITGSDQVWNLNIHEGDTSYMLDFVVDSRKKGSYAASFGYSEIPEKFKETTKKCLKDFYYYNVREKEGKDILYNLIGRESQVVVDPTLLLEKNDYSNIIKETNFKGQYIFIYNLTQSPSLIKFAKDFAENKGLKVVCINTNHKKEEGCININDASPQEFLGYLKNSEYVVTSSFHGMIFSLIFNKQFFYELNNKKSNNNSRLINLARLLGIEDREIKLEKSFEMYTPINYDEVNKIIKIEQQISLGVLEKMLKQGEA